MTLVYCYQSKLEGADLRGRAQAWYESNGFEVVGKLENYYANLEPSDCNVMHLKVRRASPRRQRRSHTAPPPSRAILCRQYTGRRAK